MYLFSYCFVYILFSYTCKMNIMQKLYNKIHLNYVIAFIIFFIYMYFGVATSDKILFSCISTSSLSYIQKFHSKMKLVKTLVHIESKSGKLTSHFIRKSKIRF